jgi:hypothetical protein
MRRRLLMPRSWSIPGYFWIVIYCCHPCESHGMSARSLRRHFCVCVHIWLRFARKIVSWSSFDPLQNLQPSLLGTLLGIGMGIEANMKCNDAKACQFPIVSRGSKNFKMGLNMLELQHSQCPPPQRPEFERSWHHPAHTLRQLSKLRVCLCDFFCLAGIWRTIRSYSPLSAW